jgi:WD40 repeat protein
VEEAGFSSRYVALDAKPVGRGRYLMAVGSTDASIRLFFFQDQQGGSGIQQQQQQQEAAGFTLVRILWHHNGPVLSLQLHPTQQGGLLLFAGATDGVVSVWDPIALCEEAQSSTEPVPSWPIPLLAMRCNQSGVNALDVKASRDGRHCTVATGGDDESLAVVTLELPVAGAKGAKGAPKLVGAASLAAHSAAVRGVALCGPRNEFVLSTGADQRVYLWRCVVDEASHGVQELQFVQGHLTEVSDVQAFDVRHDTESVVHCAVVGLGLTWLEIELPQP